MTMTKKIYTSGYLKVTDGHELYYEGWGNPKGFPILFIHGGPGSGSASPRYKKWFDPRTQNVIFYDQRGAARSRPFASIKANTTDKLVEDIERLLDHLGLHKVMLFGRSWGCTLALTYAIRHTERVSGIFLSALFLGDKNAIDYYTRGGVRQHFPEAWDRFIKNVPKKCRKDPTSYYLRQMLSTNKLTRKKYCFEWAYYEISIAALEMKPETISAFMKDLSYESLSVLEAHYVKNNCFLPNDYILNNAKRLSNIPITLLHGRYDAVCPPIQAWELKQRIPHLDLHFNIGGHVIFGKDYDQRLIHGVKTLIRKIKKIAP